MSWCSKNAEVIGNIIICKVNNYSFASKCGTQNPEQLET